MAKKEYLYETCKLEYVQNGMTIEDISKKFKVSNTTLRKWMKEGEWTDLRKQSMKDIQSLFKQSREIAYRLGENIINNLRDKKETPATILNAYTRLTSDLTHIKKFEDEEEGNEENPETPKELSKQTIHALEQTFK